MVGQRAAEARLGSLPAALQPRPTRARCIPSRRRFEGQCSDFVRDSGEARAPDTAQACHSSALAPAIACTRSSSAASSAAGPW